ncbi:hypothetical protein DXG01_005329 [Tephrocybe rancida]|nr:hypothetical protein DXG01_005329 [Tephrocybe rancida]
MVSRAKITAYNDFIFQYARRWSELFPNKALKPVLHAALHVGDFMDLFGPVQAYSSPFYERYINFFHRINTNKKVGQLELTLMKTATHAGHLRALMVDDTSLREAVLEMINTMDAIDREDMCGYRLANLLDPTLPDYMIGLNAAPMDLSDDVYTMIGVTYGTSTSPTFKNSNIVFCTPSDRDALIPATIREIYQVSLSLDREPTCKDFYFLVQALKPIDLASDPYRKYGFASGFLCKRELAPEAQILHISQIVSHSAITPIDDGIYRGLVHVLPVDRLMLSFSMDDESGRPDVEVDELVERTNLLNLMG